MKKHRYPSRDAARESAIQSGLRQRAYHCDRCFGYHLTSRMKAGSPR
ncbi:MAG: hypothetical protein WAT93_05120 [Pontixanthobacter sp.]